MPTGLPPALVMDFDKESSIIRYIDLNRRYHLAKVERIGSNPLQLQVRQLDESNVSVEWRTALELDSLETTRFSEFKRDGNFWIFGRDRKRNSDKKVTIMNGREVFSIVYNSKSHSAVDKEGFGTQVWISS